MKCMLEQTEYTQYVLLYYNVKGIWYLLWTLKCKSLSFHDKNVTLYPAINKWFNIKDLKAHT